VIVELVGRIAALPADARGAAGRIFDVSETVGTLDPPAEMEGWITKLFGSVEAVRHQRIVRVTNVITSEGALFNALRAQRPMEVKGGDEARKTIAGAVGDPFDTPETGTPADTFGRIRGAHSVTASNIAKYDGHHGVLVFSVHDPLAPMDEAMLADHLLTARRWAEAAHQSDPQARFYLLMWNSLWRAGGSIVHGHMQMIVTRGRHYPKVDALGRDAAEYRAAFGRDYFDDLYLVHASLGLGHTVGGARLMASLVPIKEREIVIVGRPGQDERSLVPAIARALDAYRALGVVPHNMVAYVAPLAGGDGDWSAFPPVVRLVDRGDPGNRTSDIGAMELYAASVISSDPFAVSEALRLHADA
jgi:hypothetical protein